MPWSPALLSLFLAAAHPGGAEPEPASPPAAPAGPTVVTIPLRPATEPRPALRYRIVPERLGLVPGNAALFYHRANFLMAQLRWAEQVRPKAEGGQPARTIEEKVSDWNDGPIADLPRDEARDVLRVVSRTIDEVKEGARRDRCDWELASRRGEGFDLLLPEIQAIRNPARVIELEARLAIAEGRLDDALASIRVGFTLGRHVAEAPYLIAHMVGCAIEFRMAGCLEALITAPGAPSLFWALADRPRPMVDLRDGFETERHLLEAELPGLARIEDGAWGLDEARRFAAVLEDRLFRLVQATPILGLEAEFPGGILPEPRGLALAAICARVAPEARRALEAEGRPAREVEAMPVVQVATIVAYRAYLERLDAAFKWANVPYPASVGRSRPAPLAPEQARANPLLAMMAALDSNFEVTRFAAVRVDRHLDALQVVEAIRLHASAHGGRLPASLDAIRDLPVPPDPANGRPFDYRVEGDSATLAAHDPAGGPDALGNSLRFQLVPAGR